MTTQEKIAEIDRVWGLLDELRARMTDGKFMKTRRVQEQDLLWRLRDFGINPDAPRQ